MQPQQLKDLKDIANELSQFAIYTKNKYPVVAKIYLENARDKFNTIFKSEDKKEIKEKYPATHWALTTSLTGEMFANADIDGIIKESQEINNAKIA